MGETVAAELRGLTWVELRPEIETGVEEAEAPGEGPLEIRWSDPEGLDDDPRGFSDPWAEVEVLLGAAAAATEMLLRAMSRARTASRWSRR